MPDPIETMGDLNPWMRQPAPPKTPKQHVLEALEQFRTALLVCRKVCNRVANGAGSPYDAEQVEMCLVLMGTGVEELTKLVQTEL